MYSVADRTLSPISGPPYDMLTKVALSDVGATSFQVWLIRFADPAQ